MSEFETRIRLLYELNNCLWNAMLLLADDCMERRDLVREKGWRWLAEKQRYPAVSCRGMGWWQFGTEGQKQNELPKSACSFVSSCRSEMTIAYFLEETALGIGNWLESMEKEKNLKE